MGNMTELKIQPADRVEVVTLMDNYIDILLSDNEVVTRPVRGKNGEISSDTLAAEHGLSLLVTVCRNGEKHTILFDTGYSRIGVPHNMKLLGIDIKEIEAIVLSHGHMDHTGSLIPLLDRISETIPIVFHPDLFLSPRYLCLDDGRKIRFPLVVTKDDLTSRNIELMEKKSPTLLAGDTILVTGEVERVTEFEKGLPNALAERNGNLEKDRILDDQSLIINLDGKGLVIISGCSHSGIINTLLYAKKITGVKKIYGVLGGFHLSGPAFEPIIGETINELKKMDPEVIVPMHCTGWKAIVQFSKHFENSFTLNSVGSKYTLPKNKKN